MFRPATIRRISYRLRTLAVWAMIPLAALNVRIVAGCICPDGHFETACSAAARMGESPNSTDSDGEASCNCSCCAHRTGKQSNSDCCRKMTCCVGNTRQPTSSPGEDSVSDKSCCHPASQIHVTSTVVVKSEVEVQRPLELMTVDAAASVQSLLAEVAHHFDLLRAETCSTPDLVITLRKLVI